MKEVLRTNMGQQAQRHDRLIRERVHDPYKTRKKLLELALTRRPRPPAMSGVGGVSTVGNTGWAASLKAVWRRRRA
jgi:hypothetical protein